MSTNQNGSAVAGGTLTGLIDTAALFGAALEKLNRASAITLIQTLVAEMDKQGKGVDQALSNKVKALSDEVKEGVRKLNENTAAAEGEIYKLDSEVSALKRNLEDYLNNFPSSVSTLTDTRIDGKKPGIVSQFVTNMSSEIGTLTVKAINALDLSKAEAQIKAMSDELAVLKSKANELDANELAQIAPVINRALSELDLSKTLAGALITVNGGQVRVDQLVKTLANQPEVQNIDLSYDDNGITGAEFTLSDSRKVLFSANRVQLPDLSLTYEFRTHDLYGLPAEFEMRFACKPWKAKVVGKMLMMDQYEPIYQSRVLYTFSAA